MVGAAGCANDGPPVAVATRASTIAEAVEEDIREHTAIAEAAEAAEAAAAAAGDDDTDDETDGRADDETDHRADEIDAGVEDGSVETVVAPTTEPPGSVPFAGGIADEAPPRPATVAVIGDSIALSAEPLVTGALEAFRLDVVAYDAVQSRRMVNGSNAVPSGRNAIREVLAAGEDPDLWVVALGTNDVGAFTGREAWQIAVDELMAEIPDDADVVWVDTWVGYLDEHAVDFNDALRDEVRWRDDVWVLDWHGRAVDEGVIAEDGVHLTESGRLEFARLINDGLRYIYD